MASSSRASQIQYAVFVFLLLVTKLKVMESKMISDNASSYAVENFTFTAPHIKYDVFVSFWGIDIRRGFLSHLMKALSQKRIVAFIDGKLERGDEISQALLGAIQRSLLSLIIFSQDYASSRWCLQELVKIVEYSREKDGQTVIPVFYKVDPLDVQDQKGTYANAFVELEKIYGKMRVQTWRSALKESANLSGFHSSNFRNDAVLVEEIVKFVLTRLNDMRRVDYA